MKFLFAVFVLLGSPLQGQPYFQTNLKPGPYSVGFKAGLHYDDGRPPIAEQYSYTTGRAVHISVWYPSTLQSGHPAMMFQEYVEELVRMINPGEVTKRSREESIHQMKVLLSQLGGDTALVNKHLSQLLSTRTNAFRNAAIIPDSFPI